MNQPLSYLWETRDTTQAFDSAFGIPNRTTLGVPTPNPGTPGVIQTPPELPGGTSGNGYDIGSWYMPTSGGNYVASAPGATNTNAEPVNISFTPITTNPITPQPGNGGGTVTTGGITSGSSDAYTAGLLSWLNSIGLTTQSSPTSPAPSTTVITSNPGDTQKAGFDLSGLFSNPLYIFGIIIIVILLMRK